MRSFIIALAFMLAPACATTSNEAAVEVRIATPEEGAAVVRADDDFIAALSPSDLSLRLQNPDGGSIEALKSLYAGELRPWSDAERARLDAMVTRVSARIQSVAGFVPETIIMVKNTDRLDGGLPHTRGNAIFWGDALPEADADLDMIFFHEVFHILSRHSAARRDELYAMVGFERCVTIEIPPPLRATMLANPDAPDVNYVVRAPDGAAVDYITPVLVVQPARFEASRPRFTQYFDLRFYAFTRSDAGACATVDDGAGDYVRVESPEAVAMIHVRAGRNTNYVLHPEELMADNFAQLMIGRADAPDPQVQQRLAAWLGVAQQP